MIVAPEGNTGGSRLRKGVVHPAIVIEIKNRNATAEARQRRVDRSWLGIVLLAD